MPRRRERDPTGTLAPPKVLPVVLYRATPLRIADVMNATTSPTIAMTPPTSNNSASTPPIVTTGWLETRSAPTARTMRSSVGPKPANAIVKTPRE